MQTDQPEWLAVRTGLFGRRVSFVPLAEVQPAGGLIGGLATLFIAFLVGGWVAGRVARYDGGRNGLLTALGSASATTAGPTRSWPGPARGPSARRAGS